MSALRWLHRYVGVVAAVLLLILAVTGGVLIFKDEIWRLRFAALEQPFAEPSPQEMAAVFAAISTYHEDRVRLIRVPQPGVPAYHVYLDGGEALWRQDGAGLIAEWAWYESPLAILTELHRHLAAGDVGNDLLGWLGIVAALMAVSGVVLWWPVRRQFRWVALRPKSLGRPALLRLHRDLGVIAAVTIVLFGLTATAVVFGQPTRAVFNRLLASEVARPPVPEVAADRVIGPPTAAMVSRAAEALPGARMMSWSPPGPGQAVHYFRLRQIGEPHPNGRSTVRIDGRGGSVLAVDDATRAPAGDRLANWMYPLHSARWGGWPYRLFALVSAVAMAVMALSGLVTFVRGSRR